MLEKGYGKCPRWRRHLIFFFQLQNKLGCLYLLVPPWLSKIFRTKARAFPSPLNGKVPSPNWKHRISQKSVTRWNALAYFDTNVLEKKFYIINPERKMKLKCECWYLRKMLRTSYNGWDWNIANTQGYFAINVLEKKFYIINLKRKMKLKCECWYIQNPLQTSYNGWDWNIANALAYFATKFLPKNFILSISREKLNWNSSHDIHKTCYILLTVD